MANQNKGNNQGKTGSNIGSDTMRREGMGRDQGQQGQRQAGQRDDSQSTRQNQSNQSSQSGRTQTRRDEQ